MFSSAKPEQKTPSKDTIQKKDSEKTSAAPNLTGIPDAMKTRYEESSGFSFDDVRVHFNSGKPAQLQALAYTQGNQVYVVTMEKTVRYCITGDTGAFSGDFDQMTSEEEGYTKTQIDAFMDAGGDEGAWTAVPAAVGTEGLLFEIHYDGNDVLVGTHGSRGTPSAVPGSLSGAANESKQMKLYYAATHSSEFSRTIADKIVATGRTADLSSITASLIDLRDSLPQEDADEYTQEKGSNKDVLTNILNSIANVLSQENVDTSLELAASGNDGRIRGYFGNLLLRASNALTDTGLDVHDTN